MTLRPDIRPDTPEWHAIRALNVGGSEVAALFGVQPDYAMSEFRLHMVKSGRIPPPVIDDAPGSRIWFGKRLEPKIGEMAAELYGWELSPGPYVTDDLCPGMGASLDFIIARPGPAELALGFDGGGVLQTKNIAWDIHKSKWVMGEPHEAVLLQLQHEIACSGLGWGVIVGLVGGNELPAYRYAARAKTIDSIRERVTDFWAEVRAGTLPRVDGSESTREALRQLYPSIVLEAPLDLSGHDAMDEICAQFIIARANRTASETAARLAANDLEAILKGATAAECMGYQIRVSVVADTPDRRGHRRINVKERMRA